MLQRPPHHCTCRAREVPAAVRIIKPPGRKQVQLRMPRPVQAGRCLLSCVHCLGSPDFACDVGLLGQAGQADRRCASFSLYPQEVLVHRTRHLIVLLVMVLAG